MILAPLGGLGLCHADTLQALSEGIPVLWLAHMNASVPNPLAALGLIEFMAMDEADFVQKAADWMASRARGDGHRQALKDQFAQSAYRDVNGFVGRMELAYRLMFDIWTSGHFQAEPMAHSRQWRVPDSHVLRRLA
jgi:predicted O-linked N-acetylglucosamine transferase (SPINDLY family)